MLVLHSTTYCFRDTSLAVRYDPGAPLEYKQSKERQTVFPDGKPAGIYSEKLFLKLIVK